MKQFKITLKTTNHPEKPYICMNNEDFEILSGDCKDLIVRKMLKHLHRKIHFLKYSLFDTVIDGRTDLILTYDYEI